MKRKLLLTGIFMPIMLMLASYANAQITLPYYQDFESSDGGFTTSGTNSSWAYGLTANGTNGWATNLDGNYNNSEVSYLMSPVFDFSELTDDPMMRFELSYDLESCCDNSWLEASLNGGDTFFKVTDTNLRYNSSNKWTGIDELQVFNLRLDSLAGKQSVIFRFVLNTDGSVTSRGLIVDNFGFYAPPVHDIEALSINLPKASASLTNSEDISVSLLNIGTTTETAIPLTLAVEGPAGTQTVSETIVGSYAAEDTINYTLSQTFDFSEPGNYYVTAFSSLPGDEWLINDTIQSKTIHASVYSSALPYYQNFNSLSDTTYSPGQGALVGLEGWSYTASATNGRLYIVNDKYTGSTSFRLGRPSYGTAINRAVFTFDGSGLSVSTDDILLDFKFQQSYEHDDDYNQVFIRGSEQDDWLVLYDWLTGNVADNKWYHADRIAVSDTLQAHGQEFSNATQILFSERDGNDYIHFTLDDIRLYARPQHDIAALSINIPNSSVILSNSEEISVSLLNAGTTTETAIPLTLVVEGPAGIQTVSETIVGSYATEDTISYTLSQTFDFSEPGNYHVLAYSSLPDDEWNPNDTIQSETMHISVYSGALPYYQNFDSVQDTTYSPGQGALVGLEGWSYTASATNCRLFLVNDRYTDSTSLRLGRASNGYARNRAVFTFDGSGLSVSTDDILLDFKFQQSYEYDDDYNQVFIRGSEQDDWLVLYDWLTGNVADNKWYHADRIAISDTLQAHGQEFSSTTQILFSERNSSASSSSYFYGLTLDDIRLYARPQHDIAALSINLPKASASFTNSEDISVSLLNLGTTTETAIPLTLVVEGPSGTQTVSETIVGSYATEDTINYTLLQTFDFSEPGNYYVTAYSSLPDDEQLTNDTIQSETIHISVYSDTLPYYQNFDSVQDTTYSPDQGALAGLEGWSYTASATNGRLFLVNDGYSDLTSLRLGRASDGYARNRAVFTFDGSGLSVSTDDILLNFKFQNNGEFRDDANKVFIRGSDQDDWLVLYDWYTGNEDNYEWIHVDRLAISDTLQEHGHEFSSTTQILFSEGNIFAPTSSYNYFSFTLDDIRLYARPQHDIASLSINLPKASANLSESEKISASLLNLGTTTETAIPLTLVVEGPAGIQTVSETIVGSYAAEDTINYTFSQTLDFSEPGNYYVTAYPSLPDDGWNPNDTIQSETMHISVYSGALPYFQNFDSVSDTVYLPDQGALLGLEGWSYYASNSYGRLSFNKYPKLTGTGTGVVINQMIFTFDGTSHTGYQDDIYLDMSYSQRGYDTDFDKIFVRGSENDDWLVLYDWDINGVNDNVTYQIKGLSLGDTLKAHGQYFSASTQIKLSEQSISTYYFQFDDFKVYTSPVATKGRTGAVAVNVGGNTFFGLGENDLQYYNDFWLADAQNDFTIRKQNFPGVARSEAVAFAIDSMIFVGLGKDASGNFLSDFYRYDLSDDEWIFVPISYFDGEARSNAVGFSIGGYGYVGTGKSATGEMSDFWKYDPSTSIWTKVADWTKSKRQGAFAFVIDNKAYVGGGYYDDGEFTQISDIQQYDPDTDTWTEIIATDVNNLSVHDATAFSLYNKGYIAYGNQNMIVEYDPLTNTVTNLGDFCGFEGHRYDPVSFVIEDNSVQIGLGGNDLSDSGYPNDFSLFYLPYNLSLSNDSLKENEPKGTLVGNVNADYAGGTGSLTYSLSSNDNYGKDNRYFKIDGNRLLADTSFNYESDPDKLYDLFIQVKDSRGGISSSPFQVIVLDINEAPTAILFEGDTAIDFSTSPGTFLGRFVTEDPDSNQTFTYSLGEPSHFSIKNDSLILKDLFQSTSNYVQSFTSTDEGGLSVKGVFVFTFTKSTPLGTSTIDQILVYPNPVGDQLYIKSSEIDKIEIWSVSGEKVMEQKVHSELQNYDMSNLSSGVYILSMFSKGAFSEVKVIKK